MSAAVRAGYKQTEVGVIPVDWQLNSLHEACSKITDGTHDTPKPVRSGVPYLTAIHVKDNHIAYEECSYLTKADHEIIFKRCNPAMGDVLLVNIGAGVATTALVKVDYEFSLKNVALLKPVSARLLGAFLNYALAHKKAGISQSLLSGGAQPFLSLFQIGEIRIPLPPLPEQRAITTVLSDVDALLAKLDALVVKKRDLKVAAMQQLLTGQTRLPGFSGEWEVKRLGDVTDVDPDNLTGNTANDYEFNYISLEDVDQGVLRGYSEQLFITAPSRARRKLKFDDVLVSTVRPNLQSHLHFKNDAPHWVCSTGFAVVRCRSGVTNSAYVFAHIFGADVSRQIETLLTGSSYPAINSRDVRALEIPIPPYEEQTAIATILSEMDTELTAIEARRDKTRALKQGMMQELLTGRIRLLSTTPQP